MTDKLRTQTLAAMSRIVSSKPNTWTASKLAELLSSKLGGTAVNFKGGAHIFWEDSTSFDVARLKTELISAVGHATSVKDGGKTMSLQSGQYQSFFDLPDLDLVVYFSPETGLLTIK